MCRMFRWFVFFIFGTITIGTLSCGKFESRFRGLKEPPRFVSNPIEVPNNISGWDVKEAIKNGKEEMAVELLKTGSLAGKISINDETLAFLHHCAQYDRTQVANELIKLGANVNGRAAFTGETPLHVAVEHHNANMLSLLVKSGANIDARRKNDYTALGWALLKMSLSFIDSEDPKYVKTSNIIELLLDLGALSKESGPKTNLYGNEALIQLYEKLAARKLALKALKTADLRATDFLYGRTIFHIVALQADDEFFDEAIQFLPENTRDAESVLNIKDKSGLSGSAREALCYAMKNNNFHMIKNMKERGAKCSYSEPQDKNYWWKDFEDYFKRWDNYYAGQEAPRAAPESDLPKKTEIRLRKPGECQTDFDAAYDTQNKESLSAALSRANNNCQDQGMLEAIKAKITATYRRLALKLHPDKCHEYDCEARFKDVACCYAALVDNGLTDMINELGVSSKNKKQQFKAWAHEQH